MMVQSRSTIRADGFILVEISEKVMPSMTKPTYIESVNKIQTDMNQAYR